MSVAAQQIEARDQTVGQAASRALQRAQGDTQKAISFLATEVRKNGALRSAILDPLIEYACGQAINNAVRHVRDKTWNAPAMSPTMSQADRVRILAVGTLSMFALPGGKKLGEANRAEVAEAAEFYGKQAEDMGHKSRWLMLISQSIPADKKVGEVMSDERLSELKQEALNHG